MADFYDNSLDNPFDANYNFGFLDSYIANVGRKASTPASQQDFVDGNGFFDTDEEDEQIEEEKAVNALLNEGQSNNDNKFFNDEEADLLSDDEQSLAYQFMAQSGLQGRVQPSNQFVPTSGAVDFKAGVNTQGWKSKVASIVDGLSEMVGNVTVTSTVRSKQENDAVGGQPNSFHLTGDAVDLRPNANLDAFLSSPQGKQYMAMQGYQIIDERGKRSGAHWHLEPAKRKYGGAVAKTAAQKFKGLNDESLDELFIPLKGTNTIRGLDNGEPVHVTDELGNEVVLVGPDDTVRMKGNVKERRLKFNN